MALTNETPVTENDAAAAEVIVSAKGSGLRKSRARAKSAAETSHRSGKASTAGKPRSEAKAAGQPASTKASIVLKKLGSPKGATIDMLMEATGWQAHSVRGFLSPMVKKKLGVNLVSEIGKDGSRRYRIDAANAK